MKRLSWLKDRHRGETCVIVCNGPSLNQMDLEWLRDYRVIGLNKIFLGFKKFGFYPKYHVAVNPKVVEQSENELRKLTCVKFIGTRGIPENSSIKENALTYFIDTRQPKHRFCMNLSDGCREGGTVTYAALQVAYHLGFKTVIIIGMDHNFEYQGKPNEAKLMSGADPNHFIANYFGYGQTWDNPDLEKSEESYRIAKDIFEQDGRKIIDATVNGECTIFPKADYREFIRK